MEIKCSKDTRTNGILGTYHQNKNMRLFSKTLYACPFSRSLSILFWSNIPSGSCTPFHGFTIWFGSFESVLHPSSILTFLLKHFSGGPLLLQLNFSTLIPDLATPYLSSLIWPSACMSSYSSSSRFSGPSASEALHMLILCQELFSSPHFFLFFINCFYLFFWFQFHYHFFREAFCEQQGLPHSILGWTILLFM